MNTQSELSFFGNHLYNTGTPSRSLGEAIADGLLLLPGYLANTVKVSLIEEEDDLRIDYLHGATHSLLMSPVYLVSLPLELIGKCMKNAALAMDHTAKAYNQITASHVQMLQDRDSTFEKIAILKKEHEDKMSQFLLREEIYNLILKVTKNHSGGFLKVNALVVKPLINNDVIEDYEIMSPSISWLPITLNELCKHLQEQKAILENLEASIATKLIHFGTASTNYEIAIKTLLKPELI